MHLQKLVVVIGSEVFGAESLASRRERALRFLEEAIETVRLAGLTEEDVDTIKRYEFSRPIGTDPSNELGGSAVTLYALADTFDVDLDKAAKNEILRVHRNKDKIRAKGRSKPAEVMQVVPPPPTSEAA